MAIEFHLRAVETFFEGLNFLGSGTLLDGSVEMDTLFNSEAQLGGDQRRTG